MSGIYDWSTDEPLCEVCGYVEGSEACEEFCGSIDYAADDADEEGYFPFDEEEFFPVFNPLTGLFPIVERIREYTGGSEERYTPDVMREIEAVERYIEHGFEELGEYLARHNEFYTYLQEQEQAA